MNEAKRLHRFDQAVEQEEESLYLEAVTPSERNRIAQWVSLVHPVLHRFHVRLEGVTEDIVRARRDDATAGPSASFVDRKMESRFAVSIALTALGTYLFGGHGDGRGKPKQVVNEVKKRADAVSAYILGEALYFSTRGLRENHGVLVNLGEGEMPKGGETPEQGANPQIAFGRIFARQDVAAFLQNEVRLLLSPKKKGSGWHAFRNAIEKERLRVWGMVIDSLENTSRFSNGETFGPMVVMHIFDQPLLFTGPFECYMGTLTMPEAVVRTAHLQSIAIHYLMPRATLLDAIRKTYPDIQTKNIHVWTLRGPTRQARLGRLWQEWHALGVHLMESDFRFPGASAPVFTDAGTYAPAYRVGVFQMDGERHLFLVDGYASSAEAVQSASLDPGRRQRTFLCAFTPEFRESPQHEAAIMALPVRADGKVELSERLSGILGRPVTKAEAAIYNSVLHAADRANMPRDRDNLTIEDFLPNKEWRSLAFSAPIFDDPYSGLPGIRKLRGDSYAVCVRIADSEGLEKLVTLKLSLELRNEKSRNAFSPLLDRLYHSEPDSQRPVKTSDVGRIINELRTWSWNSVTDGLDGAVAVNLDVVDNVVMPLEKRIFALRTLARYKRDYPSLTSHVSLEGKLAENPKS
jgi:hypothetical protein